MSSDFACEVCHKTGKRRMFTFVPKDWFYSEITDEAGNIIVVGVCSEKCRRSFWKKGPGRMTTIGKEPE